MTQTPLDLSPSTSPELAPALLQLALVAGLATLFGFLNLRYRKGHFYWWTIAWIGYALRLGAIVTFLITHREIWLFWHQVATGWTALALLWAALVFSRQLTWRPAYALTLAFPLAWSYVAIFALSDFLLAAVPAVLFLSATTLWTALVFWNHRRRTGSPAAGFVAITFLLWGLHHLDYPLLRARGAWSPWGYYLDSILLLTIGAGVLLLVIEELRQGLLTLSALSADVSQRGTDDFLDAVLRRPLSLRGVRGAALVGFGERPFVMRGAGDCAGWREAGLPVAVTEWARRTFETGQPLLRGSSATERGAPPFVAILPLPNHREPLALVLVGEVAAPFTALDDRILITVGQQIGAALEAIDLTARLEERGADLELLAQRLIHVHEEQRHRLARELHDETAQVFSALKLQLGAAREQAPSELGPRFGRLIELVEAGSRSIRSVTDDLRPAVLDDLGLIPALRALTSQFTEWSGLPVSFESAESSVTLDPAVGLAAFRAVQEGLSNAARHSSASAIGVRVAAAADRLAVVVEDDGVGLDGAELARLAQGSGRSGLFGLRERILQVGGRLRFARSTPRGLRLEVDLPLGPAR